jgi:hypothetical protein
MLKLGLEGWLLLGLGLGLTYYSLAMLSTGSLLLDELSRDLESFCVRR